MKLNQYDSSPVTGAVMQSFMQRVYQWMGAGLAITGFLAFWVSGNMGALKAVHSAFWILMIAELGLVIWLSSQALRISSAAATAGFLTYSALNGLTLSYVFLAYTQTSIATVFFITAGTFIAVSLFGWTTKSDLSSFRGFFFMALIGLIIASVVNFFLHSSALYWIISYAGVGIFIGLTAVDTQKLKQIHFERPDSPQQAAILGALILYLDFINMFLFLLRIFGSRRN